MRAQLGQTLAVLVVIALGVMLFVASAGAYEDLRRSYADTQTRLAQADLQIDVTNVSAKDVDQMRALHGVAAARLARGHDASRAHRRAIASRSACCLCRPWDNLRSIECS